MSAGTAASLINHTRPEPDVPVSGLGSCLKHPALLLGLAACGPAQGVTSTLADVSFLCPSALITLPKWYLQPRAWPGKPRCTWVMHTGVMHTGMMDTGVMHTGVMDAGMMHTWVIHTAVVHIGRAYRPNAKSAIPAAPSQLIN